MKLTTAMLKALVAFRDHGNPYHGTIGRCTRHAREQAVASLLRDGLVDARKNCITPEGWASLAEHEEIFASAEASTSQPARADARATQPKGRQ